LVLDNEKVFIKAARRLKDVMKTVIFINNMSVFDIVEKNTIYFKTNASARRFVE